MTSAYEIDNTMHADVKPDIKNGRNRIETRSHALKQGLVLSKSLEEWMSYEVILKYLIWTNRSSGS